MKSFSRPGKAGSSLASRRLRRPRNVAAATGVAVAGALALSVSALAATDLPTTSSAYNAAWQNAPSGYTAPSYDGLGVSPGTVGHVWVIVLENHAETASFSPLEGTQSSYLQNLPSQGALLTNYYGTGHSSLDNYLSMVSGQAPTSDDQDDCPSYDAMDGTVDTNGTPATNADFGQFESNAGPDAPPYDNGCVYPSSVNTVFNQLQTAGDSWKVYAQDLGGGANPSTGAWTQAETGQDAGAQSTSSAPYNDQYCGAPESSVEPAPDTTGTYGSPSDTTNAGSTYSLNFSSTSSATADPNGDDYVAKHNPLAWFSSITGSTSASGTNGGGGAINSTLCSATSGGESAHLGPLFGPNDQFTSDLAHSDTTPDLSFIIPNNCSNGHDATCTGNNLTGGTSDNETDGTINAETNNTGGTVAESAFLSIVIPEIEKSAAFQQNGMIVVTYDEAYPPFTYSADSQADSQLQNADAAGSLANDAAGETLYGRSLNWEPTGPDATVVTSNTNQVLSAGPGDSAYLDRPTGTADLSLEPCTEPTLDSGTNDNFVPFTAPTATDGSCIPGFQSNDFDAAGGYYAAPTSIKVDLTSGASSGATLASESGVTPGDTGAKVTAWTTTPTFDDGSTPYSGNVYIGQVTNAANSGTATNAKTAYTSNVQFVAANGDPLTIETTASQDQATLTVNPDDETDPFYDAYDATLGGGDTGAVVISPFVKPGTVSNNYYNHYSLLRTIEDIFGEQAGGTNDLTDGITPGSTTETTLDGPYLGFAGQPGLAPFGHDIFDTKTVNEVTQTVTSQSTVTIPGGTTTVDNNTNNSSTVTVNNNNSSTVTVPGPTVTVTKIDAIVPELKGYTKAQAEKAIRADDLKLGAVSGSGSVVSSSPAGGKEVKAGTPVSIKLKK